MELHHPPVNLKVVTVIFGQALSVDGTQETEEHATIGKYIILK